MRRELLAMEPGLVFMGNATMEAEHGRELDAGARRRDAGVGLRRARARCSPAIGLYGVIAFSVARRTREIGLRMALGASPGMVLSMVMRQGFTIVAIGMVAGGLLAAGAASALRGVLYGITPFEMLEPDFASLATSTPM